MSRFDHNKICMQKRIAYEQRNRDMREFSWVVPGFRKYPDLTWPEIAFTDIPYFFYMANQPWLYGAVAIQARIVDNYARHILPPRSNKDHEFAIIADGMNVFERAIVMRKSACDPKLKNGSHVIMRVPHLDIGIVTQLAKPMLGSQRMIGCLNKLYFPDVGGPKPSDYEAFYFDSFNFDPACCQLHRLPSDLSNVA